MTGIICHWPYQAVPVKIKQIHRKVCSVERQENMQNRIWHILQFRIEELGYNLRPTCNEVVEIVEPFLSEPSLLWWPSHPSGFWYWFTTLVAAPHSPMEMARRLLTIYASHPSWFMHPKRKFMVTTWRSYPYSGIANIVIGFSNFALLSNRNLT